MTGDDVRDLSMTVRDGRTIAWTECGAPDGRPLLRIPGTPGCRWSVRSDRSTWHERGLRVVTTERPGYGGSTRLPGRRFAEHADDLAELLDALGIDRAWVVGASGASPHILAFCARHPDRVRAATVIVGGAPLDAAEIDLMIPLNAQAFRLAHAGDVAGLRALLVPLREALLADPLAAFRATMAEAPEADQQVMSDPVWQQAFAHALVESLRPGVEGWVDEAIALDAEWTDFRLADVRTSVTWWHSDGDRNAPLAAAERLVAQLPNARMHVWTEAGHLTGYRREPEILDELLGRG